MILQYMKLFEKNRVHDTSICTSTNLSAQQSGVGQGSHAPGRAKWVHASCMWYDPSVRMPRKLKHTKHSRVGRNTDAPGRVRGVHTSCVRYDLSVHLTKMCKLIYAWNTPGWARAAMLQGGYGGCAHIVHAVARCMLQNLWSTHGTALWVATQMLKGRSRGTTRGYT